jgi:hypothetical protein
MPKFFINDAAMTALGALAISNKVGIREYIEF